MKTLEQLTFPIFQIHSESFLSNLIFVVLLSPISIQDSDSILFFNLCSLMLA